MSDLPPDGVVPPEKVKAALDYAMTSVPGMMRTVVKETLARGEAEEPTPAPPSGPPLPRRFKMQTIAHRIELPNPGMAEELRAQMAPNEVDSVIFVDGKWIYVRQRAVAVEETDADKGSIPGSGPAADSDGNGPADVPGAGADNIGDGGLHPDGDDPPPNNS